MKTTERPKHATTRSGDTVEGRKPGLEWVLWQLVDSAFPTGGFAHSLGLEAAKQHGEVGNRSDFREWLEASLRQLGRATLPMVNAVYHEPARHGEIDWLCDAFLSNHVANRASRLQGQALQATAVRVFRVGPFLEGENWPGHLGPMFGALCAALGLESLATVRLFVFWHIRSVVAAAVRLNIVGPTIGQALQYELSAVAEEVALKGVDFGLEDLAQTAPLLDLWQGAHDRLPARLFQT